MKATHKGHCQVCGAQQKLPNGVLSQHGYTVDWGFFNGVCQGAKHLPYEQSCDLVKESIEWAEAALASTIEEAAEIRALDDSHVWVEERTNTGYGCFTKELRLVEVTKVEYSRVFWIGADGKERNTTTYTDGEQTPEQYVNELHAKRFDRKVAGIKKYIEGQKVRVAEWKLSPLEVA